VGVERLHKASLLDVLLALLGSLVGLALDLAADSRLANDAADWRVAPVLNKAFDRCDRRSSLCVATLWRRLC